MLKLTKAIQNEQTLSEIGQTIDARLSFATINVEKGEVCRMHSWVRCRDFLGDVVYAMKKKQKLGIYGFSVDPEKWTIQKDHTVLVMKFWNEEYMKNFQKNFSQIVHPIEELTGLPHSEVIPTDKENVLCIKADKFWQSKVFLISLFTFLLKCACYSYKNVVEWREELCNKGGVECGYAKATKANWPTFIANLAVLGKMRKGGVTGSNQKFNVYTVHDQSGFVNVLGRPQLLKANEVSKKLLTLLPLQNDPPY